MAKGVEIEVRLRGPYVDQGDPIHMDGLLSAAWALRHPRYAHPSRTMSLSEFGRPHIPVSQVYADGASVYLASAGMPLGHTGPAVVHQTRRRDAGDWDRLDRPVNVSAGPSKDVMIRRTAVISTGMRWLCWGKMRDIRRSLWLLWGKEATPHGAIGSVRRAGAGEIASWAIRAVDIEPADVLISSDGILRRHVPAEWLERAELPRMGAVMAPYWHPERQRQTAVVGSAARLTLAARTALAELC